MTRLRLIDSERLRPAYIRYAVPVGGVFLALGLRLVLKPYLAEQIPFTIFFLAVVVSSWFGGLGPGILATVLSAIAGWHVILDPMRPDPERLLGALIFVGQGVLISCLIEAMRRSKRRVSSIVESISDGFAVFDREWQFLYVNEHGAEMAKRTVDELVGRNLWVMFPHAVGTEFWTRMHEAMRHQRPTHFENQSVLTQRWYEHTAYPTPEGLTLYTRDITDRKKARADLDAATAQIERLNTELELHVQERTAQLNATIKELEAFSYTVSHDLRAPLRAIDGFSRLLFEDYHSKLDEEGRRLIEVIRNSTVRMGSLVDGLLAFSRLGRQVMGSSLIDMHELAREAFAEVRSGEEERDIQFNLGDLPPAIGDRVLLRQVFINLLSNALKFTRDRNPATIEVGFRPDDHQNIFYVKDNGAGFDMRYADKLFGVFQRLHAVTEFEGTGLGLAIVQRVIHRHGGRVWAEGTPGAGATIYFSLPEVKSERETVDLRRPA